MTSKSALPIAIGIYAFYNAIIFSVWWGVGADYRDLVSEGVIGSRLVLPLALGAAFVALAVSRLGWWRPVLAEPRKAEPAWALALVLVGIVGFVVVNAIAVPWATLEPTHLVLLIVGGILVGFNEETVARGVLVTGLRGSTSSEVWVWAGSSLLFGAMHLPNALFGLPLEGAIIQCLFATLMGGAFYVVRRVSATLVLPMLLHGAWDFVSFGGHITHASAGASSYFQFGTYGASIVAVVAVLAYNRRQRAVA